jgi:RHS repeat-associated protein
MNPRANHSLGSATCQLALPGHYFGVTERLLGLEPILFSNEENRLVAMITGNAAVTAGVPKEKIVFGYDDQGRKMTKLVYGWNSGNSTWNVNPSVSLGYLYDGWNLLAEVNLLASSSTVVRAYYWGSDLSGTLQGAGGVGGLLMADLTVWNGTLKRVIYGYDSNGDATDLINTSGNLVAHYEYDPFGKSIESTGVLATYNPMKFSTKYADADALSGGMDLGVYYYGERFLGEGRFLSKDPMGERGGLNLYATCNNDMVNHIDPDGRDFIAVGTIAAHYGVIPVGSHIITFYFTEKTPTYGDGKDFAYSGGGNTTLTASVELENVDDTWGHFQNESWKWDWISRILFNNSVGGGAILPSEFHVIYSDCKNGNGASKKAWGAVINAAENYPYAEQYSSGFSLRNWPNSMYQPDGNNSNTFAFTMANTLGVDITNLYDTTFGNTEPQTVQFPGYIPIYWLYALPGRHGTYPSSSTGGL